MTPPADPREANRIRLAMARARLTALGDPARDVTASQIARRRELVERIAALEALVDEQLPLPLVPGTDGPRRVGVVFRPGDDPLELFPDTPVASAS